MSRVKWDEQDCGEMPLLASEKMEQLEAENKALKEIRDELLEFVIRIKSDSNWLDWIFFNPRDDDIQEGELENIIKKAQVLKEKKE